MAILIILCMWYVHIVDDFHMQGILAMMKCKSWWQENYPDQLYAGDYLIALISHAFQWSFVVHLPMIIWKLIQGISFDNENVTWVLMSVVIHTAIHAVVDNLKANKHKISLNTDQGIHLMQLLIIYVCMLYLVR